MEERRGGGLGRKEEKHLTAFTDDGRRATADDDRCSHPGKETLERNSPEEMPDPEPTETETRGKKREKKNRKSWGWTSRPNVTRH